ncbi:MAG: SDR family NAD(P)-dependent oxidoreductase, partial [Actinomycetota bacterium]|nr:SDR family NAD(P)-dependent oxidoreductase [Actinomycetota bacterium]
VARRADRLEELAAALPDAHALAVDLTDDDAPERVRAAVEERLGGELHLLVNNAGANWRAYFGDPDGGFANVERVMKLNFFAPVRLTEALLPLLRRSAPSSIVNVASVAARIPYPRGGQYAGAKFALAGWSESLRYEEAEHGVHVGVVFPGFVATEGFPQEALVGRAATRWAVSTPEVVAEAILDAGPGGKPERLTPRPWAIPVVLRTLVPGLVRRVARGMGG